MCKIKGVLPLKFAVGLGLRTYESIRGYIVSRKS